MGKNQKEHPIAEVPSPLEQPPDAGEARSRQERIAPDGQTVTRTVRLAGFDSEEHHSVLLHLAPGPMS